MNESVTLTDLDKNFRREVIKYVKQIGAANIDLLEFSGKIKGLTEDHNRNFARICGRVSK